MFALPGLLCLIASVAIPWWRLIDEREPLYITGLRGLSLLWIALTLLALFPSRRRAERLLMAGLGALLVPLLLLFVIVLLDPRAISTAVHETNQAERLINTITRTDINPQVAWMPQRYMRANQLLRNDYTLFDGLETASYFAKAGWYASVAAGALLLVSAWIVSSFTVRRCLRRWVPAGLALALFVVLMFARPLIGYYHWNRARAAQQRGEYAESLVSYRRAAAWDPRLDYDLLFHFELGRLYSHLKMKSEPDYWAAVGDMYSQSSQYKFAYEAYRRNIADPFANPALPARYANLLLRAGVADHTAGRPGTALQKWRAALHIQPENVEILYHVAIACTQIGDYTEAIRCWRNLIRINDSVGLFRIKFVAAQVYRKVITARAWSYLSWCYYRQNNYEMALRCRANSLQQGSVPLDSIPN